VTQAVRSGEAAEAERVYEEIVELMDRQAR
jgi:hypothetical protein